MGKIQRLSADEIKKIAAGEVVERPANVVKELVENSLDSGALAIDIFIEDAGKRLIRVVDDGCGMSREDAEACFEQHATSKLQRVEQLHSIETYGFRGEALSSIASISEVQLVTRESSSQEAVSLSLKYGKVVTASSKSAPVGTDLSIQNIFSNVPARKKFLKTNATEWNQIVSFFHSCCLTYPKVKFTLHHDGRMVYNCPATEKLADRATYLWDHSMSSQLLEVSGTDEKYKVGLYGYVTNHQFSRYNRNQIFLFVNNRWIKNQKLSRALVKAYNNVHQPGKFPAAFLFVTIDKEMVDINIHPRKEEVQFVNPRLIESLIFQKVKSVLEGSVSQAVQRTEATFAPAMRSSDTFPASEEPKIPGPSLLKERKKFTLDPQENNSQEHDHGFDTNDLVQELSRFGENSTQQKDSKFGNTNLPKKINESLQPNLTRVHEPDSIIEKLVQKEMQKRSFTYLGQLFKTYLLVEKNQELLLVDQHAAHERILYETFAKRFEDIATVQLMFPQTVHVTEEELSALSPYLNLLGHYGLVIEQFGEKELVVSSTPVTIKHVNLQEFVQQIAGWILEHDQLDEAQFKKQFSEHVHAQMACKAAVKAGDLLDEKQIMQLLDDLEKVDNRLTCPHGRPTIWAYSQSEIEKKFKRKL